MDLHNIHIDPKGANDGSMLLLITSIFSWVFGTLNKSDVLIYLSIVSVALVIFINIPKGIETAQWFIKCIKKWFKK